ncbi:MAG: fatty acid desaturase [Pseudomonadota bacterium]
MPIAAYLVALHSSLQHEVLHGHPTRSSLLNEALIYLPLTLAIPFRRFKTTHLRHHRDTVLTDPYDDPESWYWAEGDWRRAPRAVRWIFALNATLAGRLVLGPILGVAGLWRNDLRVLLSEPDSREADLIRDAYAHHAAGVALVLILVWGVFGVSPLVYLLLAAWPGMALLMVRTFAEHRAVPEVGERTVIVEAEPLFALLFLNNNLHAVHHTHPTEPWYRLPSLYRAQKAEILAANGGYFFPGYRAVAARWLLNARDSVVHPFYRRRHDRDASDVRLAGDPAADRPVLDSLGLGAGGEGASGTGSSLARDGSV